LSDATDIKGKYVQSVTVAGQGIITAKMAGTGVAAGVANLELVLSPITSTGSLSWKCKGSSTTTAKYYPSSCR
jgi:type IV pilus assembly protein PilA